MSFIAKDSGGVEIPKLEEGVYTAYCSMLVDLGIQENKKFNTKARKFRIVWTIFNETIEINGEEFPRTISKEYTLSLHEKSSLRKDLQAWRGKAFTEEELNGFDVCNLLNKACQLQIILQEKNGNKYNNIAGIMALPKGTTVEAPKNGKIFDTENPDTWNIYKDIPKFMQDRIKQSINKLDELEQYIKSYEEEKEENKETSINETNEDIITGDDSDDLPF